jgi:transcriptional regulator with XRE-family HTH domain
MTEQTRKLALAKAVGRAIRRRRCELSLTQQELAQRIRSTDDSVRRIENHGVSHLEVIQRYAAAFGAPASELIAEAERRLRAPEST